jgi:hypothetical protein
MAKASASKAAKKTAVKKAAILKKKTAPKKKAAAAKPVVKSKIKEGQPLFKYSDKSAGQPKELLSIFDKLRDMLLPYEKGLMKVHGGSGGQITLINHKPYELMGKMRPELWFAGVIVQKGYVGFYFMPAKTRDEQKELFEPELLKCLKGKSCFHIKKDDPVLLAQIKASLKKGLEMHKKRGWI